MTLGQVASFDDLEEGQHLALTTNGVTSRWTWDGEQMVNHAGRRVEPWFFSGAMEKGRLVHADFSPPEVREWFVRDGMTRDHYMVVDTDGEEKRDSPFAARFRDGTFINFSQVHSIIDSHRRSEPPGWANATVISLTVSAYAMYAEKERMQRQVRRVNDARTYATYARDYLVNAITSLEGNP